MCVPREAAKGPGRTHGGWWCLSCYPALSHLAWVCPSDHLLPKQEGANINKSLTTLGKVISALAEMVSGQWAGRVRSWARALAMVGSCVAVEGMGLSALDWASHRESHEEGSCLDAAYPALFWVCWWPPSLL